MYLPLLSVFERGAAVICGDFKSEPFWLKYIEFEILQKEFRNVSRIYNTMLGQPIATLDDTYARFQNFANGRALEELFTPEEFDEVQTQHSAEVRFLCVNTALSSFLRIFCC